MHALLLTHFLSFSSTSVPKALKNAQAVVVLGGDPANESQQRFKLTLSERLDNFVQAGAKVRWRALFIQYRERPFQQVYRSGELTVFPARIVCGRLGR